MSVRVQAEKRIDTPKNVRRKGQCEMDNESQKGIIKQSDPFPAERGG